MQIKLQTICNNHPQDHLQDVSRERSILPISIDDQWLDDFTGKSVTMFTCGCKYNSTNQGELGALAKHVRIVTCDNHTHVYPVVNQYK